MSLEHLCVTHTHTHTHNTLPWSICACAVGTVRLGRTLRTKHAYRRARTHTHTRTHTCGHTSMMATLTIRPSSAVDASATDIHAWSGLFCSNDIERLMLPLRPSAVLPSLGATCAGHHTYILCQACVLLRSACMPASRTQFRIQRTLQKRTVQNTANTSEANSSEPSEHFRSEQFRIQRTVQNTANTSEANSSEANSSEYSEHFRSEQFRIQRTVQKRTVQNTANRAHLVFVDARTAWCMCVPCPRLMLLSADVCCMHACMPASQIQRKREGK